VDARRAPAILSPTQRSGAAAEERACAYLQRQGLRIVARNVRYRLGEIDVIATDHKTWVFVEVRCRSSTLAAAASIDAAKRGKIRRAARIFLCARFGDRWPQCRFDAVLVHGERVQWLRSAFGGEEEI